MNITQQPCRCIVIFFSNYVAVEIKPVLGDCNGDWLPVIFCDFLSGITTGNMWEPVLGDSNVCLVTCIEELVPHLARTLSL